MTSPVSTWGRASLGVLSPGCIKMSVLMDPQIVIESISLECDPSAQLRPEHGSEKNIVQLELSQIGEMITQVSQTANRKPRRRPKWPRPQLSEPEQQRDNFGNARKGH
jgi:hypothetical protein